MRSVPTEDLDHILEKTATLWEALRGKRVFITGGTGFFGRWLLDSFLFANRAFDLHARAVVLSRKPAAPNGDAVEFVKGDIRSFDFPAGEFSYLIHAATIDSTDLFEANRLGTERVLQFAAQACTEKLLFTSSGAAYGPQPSDLEFLSEDYSMSESTVEKDGVYGQSKRVSEHLCLESGQQNGFDTIIARCFAFVGPHLPLDGNFAIGNFIRDALIGDSIRVNGNGKPIRSYLYAADLAIWLWTMLLQGTAGRVYNIGAEEAHTITEIAQIVREEVNPQASLQILGKSDRGERRDRYVPSTRRAHSELGLKNWIDLCEGIRRTADWHRA